jgi:hypothetical protein
VADLAEVPGAIAAGLTHHCAVVGLDRTQQPHLGGDLIGEIGERHCG